MTTLPQTTPVRLPQSALGANSIPVPHTPLMPPGVGFAMSGADVWRVIRNNLWLIILFLVLFGIGGVGANELLKRNLPTYTAKGLLEIRTRLITDAATGQAREMLEGQIMSELRTQQNLLLTDSLFSEILKKQAIRDCETFAPFVEKNEKGEKVLNPRLAREYLQDYFMVAPVTDSKLLSISAESANPKDAKLIVDTIVDARIEQTKNAGEERTKEQTRALDDILSQLKPQLARYQNQLKDKRDELNARGLSAQGLTSTKEIDYTSAKTELEKLNLTAGKTIAETKQLMDTYEKTGTVAEAEERSELDPQVQRLTADLSQWNIQLQLLTEKGPDSSQVKEIQTRVRLMKEELDARKIELRKKWVPTILGSAQAKAAAAEADLKMQREHVLTAEKALQNLAAEMQVLEELKDRVKATNELVQQYENKRQSVDAINRVQDQSVISWAGRPEVPEQPTFPRLKIVLPLALFIGLCLSLGIAFLRELLDDTVRRPSDISRVGHMAMLGIIADEVDDPQVAGAQLAIFDAPHSLTAEQFRQLRTRLQHAASLDTTRSIMVTGPGPEDGKTTVAVNLAAGLALNGRRILLVDSNFRRPQIHQLFGMTNDRGFSDVLNGTASLEELAQQSRVPNLAVLPAGPKPVNATELFESQLLIDFIDRALEEYDHVIFDSAPFLIVSEAAALAPRVDGVVTVIRAHAESRGLLQRMRDALKQVKAEHLGVVLNAVRAQGGGYYRRNIKAYYDYQTAA